MAQMPQKGADHRRQLSNDDDKFLDAQSCLFALWGPVMTAISHPERRLLVPPAPQPRLNYPNWYSVLAAFRTDGVGSGPSALMKMPYVAVKAFGG